MITELSHIDKTETMYPSLGTLFDRELLGDLGHFHSAPFATTYGFIFSGTMTLPNGKVVGENEYFSYWARDPEKFEYDGKAVVFTRIGFKGQNIIGGPIEERGRLTYIDGCTDTLLVYPPRMGDPSLNILYFPRFTDQSMHLHPSIRLGAVVKGHGSAILLDEGNEEIGIPLEKGMMFCLNENEKHRFKTAEHPMIIVAFHPDGDWGPTDHNHSMLNRTYLTKK